MSQDGFYFAELTPRLQNAWLSAVISHYFPLRQQAIKLLHPGGESVQDLKDKALIRMIQVGHLRDLRHSLFSTKAEGLHAR